LQVYSAVWSNHITACGHLFFQYFLQQEAQIAGRGQRNQLVVAGDFCQRLILTLVGTVDANGHAHQAWVLLWQGNFRETSIVVGGVAHPANMNIATNGKRIFKHARALSESKLYGWRKFPPS
jgi:hypothetical protein